MLNLKPTILVILDGWGLAPEGPGNAVTLADTPTLDSMLASPMRTELLCSGRAVGLPVGYMGNSEVGHMNIGAGRIVYQDMTRIDLAIEENRLHNNPTLTDLLAAVKKSGGKLHLLGLLSDGGVHSHINHLLSLLQIADGAGVPCRVHAFMDGRDTSPVSGAGFTQILLDGLADLRGARLSSMIGRYYAMDRDKRWERTQLAWQALVEGRAERVPDAVIALQQAYAKNETDEFLKPRLICAAGEEPVTVADGDGLLFFNFRADRARQLVRAFQAEIFTEFERKRRPVLAGLATMTHYDDHMPLPELFGPEEITNCLGEVLSKLGVPQLRIAETEKYAHVTYFFNCGREEPFPGEERRLIPSPREVATYDLKPQMSAEQVKDTLLREWQAHQFPFTVCNFANPDMVGHTGIIPAAVKACETVDKCMAAIWQMLKAHGGRLILTADHGNAEEMLSPGGSSHTAHSKNPVALVIMDDELQIKLRPGKLGDLAPTILALWGIKPPLEMTGESLIVS